MRGGFAHNEILIAPVEAVLGRCATFMQREYPVQLPYCRGAIDLFAQLWMFRLAVEAEMSADRVDRDIAKALAVDATHLWIVVPNGAVRRTVRRRMARQGFDDLLKPQVCVLTPPLVPPALESCFPLFSTLIPDGNQLPHPRNHTCLRDGQGIQLASGAPSTPTLLPGVRA